MEENKCEKADLAHAWRSENKMVGFSLANIQNCANCGLKREHHTITKEYYSYSDGRPSEDCTPIRPV